MLLWRRVSAVLLEEGCPGTFSQSISSQELAERPVKISLFVSFECDSLNEEVEGRKFGKLAKLLWAESTLAPKTCHALLGLRRHKTSRISIG